MTDKTTAPSGESSEECQNSVKTILAVLKRHGEILEEHSHKLEKQSESVGTISTSLALLQQAQIQQNQIASNLYSMTAQMQQKLADLYCLHPHNALDGKRPKKLATRPLPPCADIPTEKDIADLEEAANGPRKSQGG